VDGQDTGAISVPQTPGQDFIDRKFFVSLIKQQLRAARPRFHNIFFAVQVDEQVNANQTFSGYPKILISQGARL